MLTAYNIRGLLFIAFSIILFYALIILIEETKKSKRDGQNGKSAPRILGLVIVIPLALFDLLIWLFFLLVMPFYPHYSFDQIDWATDIQRRYMMTDDLIDSERLVGLSRSQVETLLGNPYRDWEKLDHTIRYDIGDRPTPGLDLDSDELVLDLENGKVVKCYLHET